ncbi:MAG TPA: winged helix-turn-helix domain-containing protein [Terriglobales bacterium]|jgi:DNA-binding winged helix-turn-helix (wHTH) protein|nr:winged helix-turn-helix domain-containing protein [Terriglobales bacterium]
MSDKVIRFGEFQIDRGRFQLFCQESPVRMEGRPMQLLLLLVERAGELVTREQIAECLWGRDVFVDVEQGINTAIRKVRRALNDCADEPRYLQTVVGRGYRFIGEPVYDDDADTGNAKMFTAEELGQAVLSAAGLDPSEYISSGKMRGD